MNAMRSLPNLMYAFWMTRRIVPWLRSTPATSPAAPLRPLVAAAATARAAVTPVASLRNSAAGLVASAGAGPMNSRSTGVIDAYTTRNLPRDIFAMSDCE